MNSSNQLNFNSDAYEGLYEIRPSTIFCSTISFTILVLNLVLLCGIIWYEKHLERSLLNKLVISLCWTWCFTLAICQLDVLRYMVGRLPEFFCIMMGVLKNCARTQLLILLDVMVIIQYLFVFVVKNPTGIMDNFWGFFISLWVTIFSLVFNTSLSLSPGRRTMQFYTCSGIDKAQFKNLPLKLGHPIEIITIGVHIFVKSKIWLFRHRENLMDQQTLANIGCYRGNINVDQRSLADLVRI